ncbi:MAG TPA: hypothetical protein VGB54_03870 [Allosphingosinicella sp.]|jgi:hypothetical protein
MLLGLLLTVAQAGQEPALPPSLAPGALEACAPATLEAAETCLRNSLSREDLSIVLDRIPARRFRPHLDCAIETAWRLRDRTAPMAKVMDRLLGVHRPGFAASMIISDMQGRALGEPLPFDDFREAIRANPRMVEDTSTCPDPTPDPS